MYTWYRYQVPGTGYIRREPRERCAPLLAPRDGAWGCSPGRTRRSPVRQRASQAGFWRPTAVSWPLPCISTPHPHTSVAPPRSRGLRSPKSFLCDMVHFLAAYSGRRAASDSSSGGLCGTTRRASVVTRVKCSAHRGPSPRPALGPRMLLQNKCTLAAALVLIAAMATFAAPVRGLAVDAPHATVSQRTEASHPALPTSTAAHSRSSGAL